jgi:hypothetical protein
MPKMIRLQAIFPGRRAATNIQTAPRITASPTHPDALSLSPTTMTARTVATTGSMSVMVVAVLLRMVLKPTPKRR